MRNVSRRQFMKEGTMLASALGLLPLYPQMKKPYLTSDTVHRFSVGQAQCSILKDFTHSYQTQEFFSEGADQLASEFDAYANIENGQVHSPYDAMLVQLDGQNLLIDTGIGFHKDPITIGEHQVTIEGQLQTLLQEAGLTPADVDQVIISHFHPDHIGGIYSDKGSLNFPNARFVVGKKEWDFWHSSEAQQLPSLFTDFVQQNISPLDKSDVRFLENDGDAVIPGLTAILAEGHTPGHLVFMLESDGEKLLYAADTFLHPIHIEHLEVSTVYDYDQKQARQSREKVLQLAQEEEALIHAFHFAYPGLGRVSRKDSQWQWEYSDQASTLNNERR